MSTKVLIFGPSSTSVQSALIAVMPRQCVQLNAWNLGVGDSVCVDMIRVSDGEIQTGGDSCVVSPGLVGQMSLDASPYAPCNMVLCMDETRNMIVLSTPGTYRLTLDPPAALGTVVVEATFHHGEDACPALGSECCCMPETPWIGSSTNPCLVITPGGDTGHSPVFSLDVCCLLQQVTTVQVPQLSDEVIFLSGGACFRTTIDELFSNAIVCDSIGEFPLGAPAAGDQLVGVDAGAACVRRDAETLVEFFETPWTGISITPALVITPGGINGHGPTFSYDLCADLQALPVCACEPAPGDLVPVIQGGQCTLATWPTVDLCEQIGLLNAGVLTPGDVVPVREAGGNCKAVLATDFGAAVAFPLLAPDGSCGAPSYSFTSSPDSGMFYFGDRVRIADDTCDDFIDVGASISAFSSSGDVSLTAAAANINVSAALDINLVTSVGSILSSSAGLITWDATSHASLTSSAGSVNLITSVGAINVDSAANVALSTGSALRVNWLANGAWSIGGSQGTAGQVITSNGVGVAPTWQSLGATQILAASGSCAAPTYSFTASPDSGMFYDPAGVGSVVIGDDNCADSIAIGASISITTATVLRHRYTSLGEWEIGGTAGVAGQAIVSNGPGVAPTWQTPSATVRLNEVADANGSATRAHAANQITWTWQTLLGTSGLILSETGSGAGASLMQINSTSAFFNNMIPLVVTWGTGGTFQTGGGPAAGNVWHGRNNDGQEIVITSGDGPAGFNGGGLNLSAGTATGGNTGGGVGITAGSGLAGGLGGSVFVAGGISTGAGTPGGDVRATGGANTAGGGVRGGSIDLRGGAATNLPTLQQGNVYINSQLPSAIATTATSGFAYLPMTSGVPTGVPAVIAPTGLPVILQVLGATVVMHIYDGVAWRSATFV